MGAKCPRKHDTSPTVRKMVAKKKNGEALSTASVKRPVKQQISNHSSVNVTGNNKNAGDLRVRFLHGMERVESFGSGLYSSLGK